VHNFGRRNRIGNPLTGLAQEFDMPFDGLARILRGFVTRFSAARTAG
jgi:hypothetical protein